MKKIVRFLPLVAFMLLVSTHVWADDYSKAERLYERGKWAKAAKAYDEAVKVTPSVENLLRLAEAHLYSFNYKGSEKAFKAVLAREENDSYSKISLAMLKTLTGKSVDQRKKAMEILVSMSDVYGDDARYWRALGFANFKWRHDHKAIECFEEAVKRDPGDYVSYFFMGLVYELHLDFDDAIRPYKKAVEINPNYAQAVNNLGYNFKERHYYSYAQEMYLKAIELDPEHAGYYYNLGNVFNHWKMRKDAFYLHRKAASLDPKFAKAHYNVGKNLVRFGFYREGIKHLKLLVKYWTPDLPERDVPHRDKVKSMIEDVEIMIKKRKERDKKETAERKAREEAAEREMRVR